LANASWGKLAAEFLQAKDDPATLKPFVCTVLAQPWRDAGDEIDEAALRIEDFGLAKIPAEVLLLTCGCDVQDDRLELSFIGFARNGTMCVLAHHVLFGPVMANEIWADLDDALRQRWPHPLGGTIGVDAAVVDCGDGGIYDTVMKFAEARAARRIWAGKGVPGFSRPAFQKSSGLRSRGSQRLYLIGSDSIKSILFARLRRGQTIKFSHELPPIYFEQLSSERLITKMSRGKPIKMFERIPGRRAETLDCLVMAYAARQGLALNLDAREADLRLEPQPQPRPVVTRSRWVEGGY
jgi:phage terminase large subunit GpA-like protein